MQFQSNMFRSKVVDFQESWMDSHGFLTQLPGDGSFLDSLNLPEGVASAIGVIKRTSDDFNTTGQEAEHEQLHRFEIRDFTIRQELPYKKYAIIHRDRVIIRYNTPSTVTPVLEEWRKFAIYDHANIVVACEWKLVGERIFRQNVVDPRRFVPSTMEGLFKALEIRLTQAWEKLVPAEYKAPAIILAAREMRLAVEKRHPMRRQDNASDTRTTQNSTASTLGDEWVFRAPGTEELNFWWTVTGYTTGMVASNPELLDERLEQLQHFRARYMDLVARL